MSDLIDRQEAIEHCKKRLLESAYNNVQVICDVSYTMQEIADNRIENWLKELHSIDTVKHGKWIGRHEMGIFSHPDSITYECSECGYSIYTIYGMPRLTNFCPKCGAEMKGEENETD